jgi:hypothetical protein
MKEVRIAHRSQTKYRSERKVPKSELKPTVMSRVKE